MLIRIEHGYARTCAGEEYVYELECMAELNGIELLNETNVDGMVDTLMGWIQGVNKKYMRKSKHRSDRKFEWWTNELRTLKGKVRKSRRAWQREKKRESENVEARKREYKRLLNEYKFRMRRVKEENWRQFSSVSSSLDPWGPVYKICRGKYARQCMSALRVNGVTYSTWNECASVMMERFFPATSMQETRVNDEDEERENEGVRCFEWDEVNEAVKKARLRKAPGLDGINGEMMRGIWKAIPGWMLSVYNECLRSGCFPKA